MLTAAAAVLSVHNLEAALAYYQASLGFEVTFRWGDPTTYACLCRDEVQLHLAAAALTGRTPGQSQLCLFVRNVDALHAELLGRGAPIAKPPQTYPYGMREFDLTDPDGNRLIFGMAAQEG
jgi:uncharacterized glyoxalase superfamily protein PhnB